MPKFTFYFLLIVSCYCHAQQTDFNHINFSKADAIANNIKTKKLYELKQLTNKLTQNLETDIEKFRAIYIWICNNIANDFNLYFLNNRKRKRFATDSIKLKNWNSKFKKKLFKQLSKKKRTICSGYAYLLKEMCANVGIECKMVNGYGRTSSVNFNKAILPNHTWNVVKINDKWYLCDPTWATGISFPEEGKFKFDYNNGYFLTTPKLFILNHFPLDKKYALLDQNTPSFSQFVNFPLLYGDAYTILEEHISPEKMHHVLQKGDEYTFEYQLKKGIDARTSKFILDNGSLEKTVIPKIEIQNKLVKLTHTFTSRGFYDVHLYIENKLVATYTFKITKS